MVTLLIWLNLIFCSRTINYLPHIISGILSQAKLHVLKDVRNMLQLLIYCMITAISILSLLLQIFRFSPFICHWNKRYNYLTIILLNFLNGIIWNLSLSFLATRSWSANTIDPGHTAHTCRLAWLTTGDKGLSLSVPAG